MTELIVQWFLWIYHSLYSVWKSRNRWRRYECIQSATTFFV